MDAKNTNATENKTKLERLEERITELEKQKKAIKARENEKKRKERTRQLIQIGAIAIKYFNCPNDIEPEEFEERIKLLADEIKARQIWLESRPPLVNGYCSGRTKTALPSQYPGNHSDIIKNTF